MSSAHKFWDRLARRYAAQPIANEAAYQTKLAETRRHLRPDMDVFEFGCGTGSTALVHAPYVRSIRAVDFSPVMIEIAREKAAVAGITNAVFETGDIDSIDLAPASLDMVLGMSILHLLRNRKAVIDKVFAALKPGGLFVSSTICMREASPVLSLVTPLTNRLGVIPYLVPMTSDQLVNSLTGAGFAIAHRWQPDRKSALFVIARRPAAIGQLPGQGGGQLARAG